MNALLATIDDELAGVVEQVRRSLIQVSNGGGPQAGRGMDPSAGSGAGAIWHPDGLILTNAHVVRQRAVHVTLPDGRELPAKIVAHDRDLDLAALAVEARDLPSIALGESTKLRPGELVLALGHPWGVAGAVTAGVVIGVGVARPAGRLLEGGEWQGLRNADREWITASLHVRPGYSGGPLVDAQGRLVGINTIMAGPGVGVAVPVHVAKSFLKETLGRM
jgi:serine protease Do